MKITKDGLSKVSRQLANKAPLYWLKRAVQETLPKDTSSLDAPRLHNVYGERQEYMRYQKACLDLAYYVYAKIEHGHPVEGAKLAHAVHLIIDWQERNSPAKYNREQYEWVVNLAKFAETLPDVMRPPKIKPANVPIAKSKLAAFNTEEIIYPQKKKPYPLLQVIHSTVGGIGSILLGAVAEAEGNADKFMEILSKECTYLDPKAVEGMTPEQVSMLATQLMYAEMSLNATAPTFPPDAAITTSALNKVIALLPDNDEGKWRKEALEDALNILSLERLPDSFRTHEDVRRTNNKLGIESNAKTH